MILGWSSARLSSPFLAGIPYPAFFGAALDFPLALDLALGSSEDLGGAGATGDMTGTADAGSTTITPTSRTVMSSVTGVSITVAPVAATLGTATSATVISAIATRFTKVRAVTDGQEPNPGVSAALGTAVMFEAFPPADGRASEEATAVEDTASGSIYS